MQRKNKTLTISNRNSSFSPAGVAHENAFVPKAFCDPLVGTTHGLVPQNVYNTPIFR